VRIFGADGDQADAVAYSLGRALQLANILRDIAEDAERGRLYLPSDLLDAHGISSRHIADVIRHPNLKFVGADLVKVAYKHFADAESAMRKCPRAAMRPARLMGAAYRAILDKVVERGFEHLDAPVKVGKLKKLWIVLRHGIV
jgi:phytoene synthase